MACNVSRFMRSHAVAGVEKLSGVEKEMSLRQELTHVAFSDARDATAALLSAIGILCDDQEEREDLTQRACAVLNILADNAGVKSRSFSELVEGSQKIVNHVAGKKRVMLREV